MEKSIAYINPNVVMSDAGIATSTIREFRILCRKSSITIATIITARKRSAFTAFADSSVNVELSSAILKTIPCFSNSF
jgi:hypothetical protein